MMALCGSVSLSARLVCRNDPALCVELLSTFRAADDIASVNFSFSRCCFFSRQIVNAQPTAWLSLSPCIYRHVQSINQGRTSTYFSCYRHGCPLCTSLVYYWMHQQQTMISQEGPQIMTFISGTPSFNLWEIRGLNVGPINGHIPH